MSGIGMKMFFRITAGIFATGLCHGAVYESDEIHQLAIEITDWNMTESSGDINNIYTLLPKEKTIDFPPGLRPENIVSVSAVIKSDDGLHLLPLGTLHTKYDESGPGGNIRIITPAANTFKFSLNAFGKFASGTPSTPRGVFANSDFAGTGNGTHRGWLYVNYLGDKIVPTGTSTDVIHSFMFPVGSLNMNTLRRSSPDYFSVVLPEEFSGSNDIVGLSATIMNDDGTRVDEMGRNGMRGGYVMIDNDAVEYSTQGAQTLFEYTNMPDFLWSSLVVNRGWILISYIGNEISQPQYDRSIVNTIGRRAYPLGELDLSRTLGSGQYPIYTVPLPNPPFNALKLGSMGAVVTSDDNSSTENFVLPMACRDYLSAMGQYCVGGQGAKGGNVRWKNGHLELDLNREGDNAGGANRLFNSPSSNWNDLGRNRGFAQVEYGDPAVPIANFSGTYTSVPAIHIGKSNYYSFYVPPGGVNVRVTLSGAGLSGDADLLVKKNGWPDEAGNYDCYSESSGSEELCDESRGLSGSGTYYIKVLAYSELSKPVGLAASYEYPSVIFQPAPGLDGLISIEAENFNTNLSQGAHSWTKEAATRYPGSQMRATPDNGTNVTTNIETTSPRMDYVVNFPEIGTYYVWGLGVGPNAAGDSYHMGLNGAVSPTADKIQGFAPTGNWSNATADGPPAQIQITANTVQTLNVWMREDGFALDKIVLTKDKFYVPKGSGPAATFTTLGPYTLARAKYEGENYSAQSGNALKTSGSVTYMDYGTSGSYLQWNTVDGGTGGKRTLTFQFANGSTSPARKARLLINGIDMGEKTTPYTGGWTTWQSISWDVSLNQGSLNTVKLMATTDGPNIDYFTVKNATPAVYLEAEDGALVNYSILNDLNAFGRAYITQVDGNSTAVPGSDRASFKFNITSAGTYRIWVRVIAPSTSGDSFWGQMDGGSFTAGGVSVASYWHWDTMKNGAAVMAYTLTAGAHTFTIANREATLLIDRLYITSLGDTPP